MDLGCQLTTFSIEQLAEGLNCSVLRGAMLSERLGLFGRAASKGRLFPGIS
jgi:hypothetical protein